MIQPLVRNILPADPAITIRRAKGAVLWDSTGKDYIDFSSQTLNLSLGQCHPSLSRVAIRQLKQFTFLSTRFVSEPLVKFALELVKLAPAGLSKVNLKLTNGSDANESAFKRVRKYHQKQTILACSWSHHGETSETINASGKRFENRYYIGGSGKFLFFNPPHQDFFPFAKTLQDAESTSLAQVSRLIETHPDTCAVIVEPILVNAGVYILSPWYLKRLRRLCDRYEISLIFDEIQTMGGWLGDMFAAQKYGVTPDLITLGKALSPGFPLAGVLMKEEYDVLDYGEDEFTYGGHPVSCAVALATLDILQKMSIERHVWEREKIIKQTLEQYQRTFRFIKEIRGVGLIWAIDFDLEQAPLTPSEIYQRALQNGVVLRKSRDGMGSSLVLKPPLVISKQQLRIGFERLLRALTYHED